MSRDIPNACVFVVIFYCSSAISEEHSGDSVPTDDAAARLCSVYSDWLESQQGTVPFLHHARVVITS